MAYILGIGGVAFLTLGSPVLKFCSFSFGFLLLFIPPPASLVQAGETALQAGSAWLAEIFFSTTQIVYLREGFSFYFEGFHFEVARECSGIRSTLALFIVSILAAHLFLSTNWKRLLLIAVIIPLGVIRNAFRIWVLAVLSIHLSPRILDSPLHHQGGPLFFILSLIPLGFLIVILHRSDRRLNL